MDRDRPEGLECLTDLDLSWPSNADTLIPAPGTRGLVAPIQTQFSGDFARIEGFRAAAQIVGERLIEGERVDERLLYPFASLWRHHLELQLKVLLPDLEQLLGEEISDPSIYQHSLTKLWAAVGPKIAQVFPEDDKDRAVVGRVLSQLSTLDPDAQHFRYATHQNGKRTLSNFRGIDAAAFHQALMNVSSYLDAALNGAGFLIAEIDAPSSTEMI
ncbi:hypothetical protein [Nocardioides sp. YIM 152315]|uniref:hypothetical protein n=1 Tax=Nocardioides sp. YIM 152315 TaxID=3031760 RepID=UPI0023DCDAB9|nr:hypothetical protein [Nocardioides sp. YIM 152315]MDF1605900.1 hypothetical protein [Nocardioides sp. YIM 152315]